MTRKQEGVEACSEIDEENTRAWYCRQKVCTDVLGTRAHYAKRERQTSIRTR